MRRPHAPADVLDAVIIESGRRCCVCYSTTGDATLKGGEIAALATRLSGETTAENLAFLCLEHHKELDDTHSSLSTSDVRAAKKKFQEYIQRDKSTRDLIHFVDQRPEALYELTPRQFEEVIAELLQSRGLQIVGTTAQAADGGIDIIVMSDDGRPMLVQCKRYGGDRRVGVNAVRELLGVRQVMNAASCGIVTSACFTSAAMKLAEGAGVELTDRDEVLRQIRRYASSSDSIGDASTSEHKTSLRRDSDEIRRASDPDLGVLVDWFSKASAAVSGMSLLDTGQILLCAKELGLESHHLTKRLEQMVDLDDPPEHQAHRIVLSFLRQIVLYRYGRNEAERRAFLEYWLHKRNRGRLDIVSRAYAVGLALEQQSLVPVDHRDYITTWFSRKRLRANRVRGWVPHYLRLAGRPEEARERAESFIAEREPNGSWRGGYDATLAILYALLVSGLVPVASLSSTVDYAARRYDEKCTGDHGTDALALKTLFRSGLVTRSHVVTIENALRRASGVFLSHTSSDKPFVRKLAEDLQTWGVWLDEEEVKVGDSIVGRVQDALSECRHVVVVLSRESVKSRWVQKEVSTALMSSLAGSGVRLLPVLIEDCDIPQLLREVRYADFRDSYKNGFRELLRGLDSCG